MSNPIFAQTPLTLTSRHVFEKTTPRADGAWGHYWEYDDGSEGGELWLGKNEVIDFDGAFDLPDYVAAELNAAGYATAWRDDA